MKPMTSEKKFPVDKKTPPPPAPHPCPDIRPLLVKQEMKSIYYDVLKLN